MPPEFQVQVVVGSRIEYIDALHALAEEMARIAGLAEEERFSFALAVREAVTNAVTHGNGEDRGKKVTLTFALDKTCLVAAVADEGKGFGFDDVKDPRLVENRFKPSGRGLLLIRSFVDEVVYDFDPGRGCELRLVKHLVE
ncbi:MAG: ATP-binding protein [Acidobacteriota bacterium]